MFFSSVMVELEYGVPSNIRCLYSSIATFNGISREFFIALILSFLTFSSSYSVNVALFTISFNNSSVFSYSGVVVKTVIENASERVPGSIFIPLSSKISASSCDVYFFVPFIIAEAVRFPIPYFDSKKFPPLANMLIATISFVLFGVKSKVAPFASVYSSVPFAELFSVGAAVTEVLFETLTSLQLSGSTIETADLFTPRYLFAAFFTS